MMVDLNEKCEYIPTAFIQLVLGVKLLRDTVNTRRRKNFAWDLPLLLFPGVEGFHNSKRPSLISVNYALGLPTLAEQKV